MLLSKDLGEGSVTSEWELHLRREISGDPGDSRHPMRSGQEVGWGMRTLDTIAANREG